MQSMDSSRPRFTPTVIFTGPRAGTLLLPIRPSSSVIDDDDPAFFNDYFGYEEDYLPTPAAHHGSSNKRSRLAATDEAILSLPELTGRSRSGEECAICLQDFRADETLRAMPACSHAFHQHCISEWLSRNAACPLCRHRLPEQQDKQSRRIEEAGSSSSHHTPASSS